MVFVTKIVASIAFVTLALVSNAPQVDAHSNAPLAHRAVHARAGQGARLVARPVVQRTEEELERIQRRSSKVCRSKEESNNTKEESNNIKKKPTKDEPTSTSDDPESSPTPTPMKKGGSKGGSGGGKGKKGLGWSHLAGNADITKFITPDVSFVYTWGPQCPKGAKNLQCASMLWGSKMLKQFRANRGNAPILMGMNEVNQDDQANMSVAAGVKMWNNEICKYSKGKFLVSPSTNQSPSGNKWINEFLKKADCKPDAISVHYYGVHADAMISKLKEWHAEYKTPLWLTEFACQDYSGNDATCSDPVGFMKTIVKFCEETEWITAYFAFGWKKKLGHLKPKNRLMTIDGGVSHLGDVFLNTKS